MVLLGLIMLGGMYFFYTLPKTPNQRSIKDDKISIVEKVQPKKVIHESVSDVFKKLFDSIQLPKPGLTCFYGFDMKKVETIELERYKRSRDCKKYLYKNYIVVYPHDRKGYEGLAAIYMVDDDTDSAYAISHYLDELLENESIKKNHL
jgi:hypothetical protein